MCLRGYELLPCAALPALVLGYRPMPPNVNFVHLDACAILVTKV